MKTKLKYLFQLAGLCVAVLTLPPCVRGQGTILFNNRVVGVVVAPVYGQEPTNPTLSQCGNTSSGTPAGSAVYSGPLLSGSGFTAQLWAGPLGTSDSGLTLAATTTFQTGSIAGFWVAPTSHVALASVPVGAMATAQIRVWDNQGGTVTNWAAAQANSAVPSGSCASFTVGPLGSDTASAPNLTNLVSLNLHLPAAPPFSLLCATNKTIQCGLGSGGPALPAFSLLRTFSTNTPDGQNPKSELLQASDGLLYGTTYLGGSNGLGYGTVFKLSPDGAGYSVIHHFSNTDTNGRNPAVGLFEDADGSLYGTAQFRGASSGPGTVFKINKDGSGYTVIHNFSTTGGDGQQSVGALVRGTNGALYGTTKLGGTDNAGTVFKVNPEGTGYSVIHHFTTNGIDGGDPEAGLVAGSNGKLYGATHGGGTNGFGTIFTSDEEGTGYSVIHHFSAGGDGHAPYGGLLEGSDGGLYGTTYRGGAFDRGTVFKLGKDGSGYTVIHHFFTGTDARYPYAGLVEGADGTLYGTTSDGGANGFGAVYGLNKDGSSYGVLYSFATNKLDGIAPSAGLILGRDGALYGTTEFGGGEGQGTVFRLELPCSWDFDPPTPVNACCGGSNVTITVLSTVTNGVCPQLITRTWSATDCCTNNATCSQTVTLVDARPLIIACPGNITTNISGASVVVNYPNPSVTNGTLVGCIPPSGSLFPLGTTPVICTATNACGSNTCSFSVTVQPIAAPVITQQPQSQTNAVGSDVTFSVTATGAPPLGYQWRVNATNILSGQTNPSFTVFNVQPYDAGAYDVIVSNPGGSVTSTPAMLMPLPTSLACCTDPARNLVVNGSFEVTSPAMNPNNSYYFGPPSDPAGVVAGWSTPAVNGAAEIEIWCNLFDAIPASDGSNHLELNAELDDQTVSQVVTGLIPGRPAILCFDYTGRFGLVGGTYNNDFTLTLSGGYSLSVPLDPPSYAVGGWQHFTAGFVPSSPTVTISFRGKPHSSVTGGAHIDNVALTQPGQADFNVCGQGHPIKILCIGDSITDDVKHAGAWRLSLEALLTAYGYSFEFVGQKTSPTASPWLPYGQPPCFTPVPPQLRHEGYSGYTINGILGVVQSVAFQATPAPDIILIMIGTNDMPPDHPEDAANALAGIGSYNTGSLLYALFAYAQNANVVLAKIPTYSGHADSVGVFNTQLESLVNYRRLALGQKVFLADMFSAISTQLDPDGVHPNCTGLGNMAQEWMMQIQAITGPLITRPADITVSTPGGSVAVNFPTPTVTGATLVGCVPPSGSLFPPGTTVVTCTAMNGCAMSTCTFNVTVIEGCGCAQAPNLVQNGGFEDPSVPPVLANSFDMVTAPGWTGSSGTIEIWNGNYGAMAAHSGLQHLEINGDSDNETVSQVISGLTSGVAAKLCFWYVGRPGFADNSFQVEVRGSDFVPVTLNPAAYANEGSWLFYSATFVPSSSTVTLAFTGTSTAGISGGAHIDDVSVRQVGPAPCVAATPGPTYSTWPSDLTFSGYPSAPVPSGGILKLTTTAINGQLGGAAVSVPFNQIHAFRATFQLYIGGSTWPYPPYDADGFSFNLADDVPAAVPGGPLQEGIGTGLTVEFDTFSNGAGDPTGIFLKSGGPTTPPLPWPGPNPNPSQGPSVVAPGWLPVEITMDTCGNVQVFYNSVLRASGQIGYIPGPTARFALGAATGELNDNHWVKDLSITTESAGCSPDITVIAPPNQCCVPVTYPPPCFTDKCDPNLTIACVPPSGSQFCLGTNRVCCTATDAAGNQAHCGFYVIVKHTAPPVITCAPDKTVNCDAFTFDTPTATDPCGATVTVLSTTVLSGPCPKVIRRIWQATEPSGNTATCSQTVTVLDTTPPALTCADNKTVECGSAWSFDVPTAFDACDNASATITDLGTVITGASCSQHFTKTWRATDACGNSATCSQTVTVVDTPAIHCPPNITCETCEGGLKVCYDATATNTCDNSSLPVTLDPPSCTFFSLGTHLVTATTTDTCGNTSSCTFTVTVVDALIPQWYPAGQPDGYWFPFENAWHGYCLDSAYPGALWRNYDNWDAYRPLGQSWEGLPPNIRDADVTVHMRPRKYLPNLNYPEDDTISFGLETCNPPVWLYSFRIGFPGIVPLPWINFDLFCCPLPKPNGLDATIDFNLADMPITHTGPVLTHMNSTHRLDMYVENDTQVDFAWLRLHYCPFKSGLIKKVPWLLTNAVAVFEPKGLSIAVDPEAPLATNMTATLLLGTTLEAGASLDLTPLLTPTNGSFVCRLTGQGQAAPLDTYGLQFDSMSVTGMTWRALVPPGVPDTHIQLLNGGMVVGSSSGQFITGTLICTGQLDVVFSSGTNVTAKFAMPIPVSIATNQPPVLADTIEVTFARDVPTDIVSTALELSAANIPKFGFFGLKLGPGAGYDDIGGEAVAQYYHGQLVVSPLDPNSSAPISASLSVAPTNQFRASLGKPFGLFKSPDTNASLALITRAQANGLEIDLPSILFDYDDSATNWIISATSNAVPLSFTCVQVWNNGLLAADITNATAVRVSDLPSAHSPSLVGVVGDAILNRFLYSSAATITVDGTASVGTELRVTTHAYGQPLQALTGERFEAVRPDVLVLPPLETGESIYILSTPVRDGDSVIIRWGSIGGVLEGSPSLSGPWTLVPGTAGGEVRLSIVGTPVQFFRVRGN